MELVGPCIPDLKRQLGVDYEEMSQAFIAPSIVLISGAVVGGIIHQRFHQFTLLFFAIASLSNAIGEYCLWKGGI